MAIAKFLVGEGHNVVVSARSEAPLEEFRTKYPDQVRVVAGDITDSSLSKKIAQVAENGFSRLDGLVINHGVVEPVDNIANGDIKEWRSSFDVNVFSAVQLVCARSTAHIKR